ncbi:MAG: LysR family transcriptional regulator [Hyphomicrobiales bacterium]|nr:LysR family transcriptional regulator [Hyphomicrobiales bacterium]
MDTLARMQAFVQVVDSGGFSAAARKAGKSKALLSKYVRDLEDELGVRLLNRTTRQLSPTEAGVAYHREAVDLLQRLDDLTASVRDSHGRARGHLRVSAPRSYGDAELGGAVVEFLETHPEITVDLRLDDRFVDLVEEGFDVAIRVSEPLDSSLIARRLSTFRVVTCASPSWIERNGRPEKPDDLLGLPAICDTNARNWHHWPFMVDGERTVVAVSPRMNVNGPQVTAAAAAAGIGVARVPLFAASRLIEEGALVVLLEDFELTGLTVNAVYPHRRHLSAKVRVFVDFLVGWFERRKRRDPCL